MEKFLNFSGIFTFYGSIYLSFLFSICVLVVFCGCWSAACDKSRKGYIFSAQQVRFFIQCDFYNDVSLIFFPQGSERGISSMESENSLWQGAHLCKFTDLWSNLIVYWICVCLFVVVSNMYVMQGKLNLDDSPIVIFYRPTQEVSLLLWIHTRCLTSMGWIWWRNMKVKFLELYRRK